MCNCNRHKVSTETDVQAEGPVSLTIACVRSHLSFKHMNFCRSVVGQNIYWAMRFYNYVTRILRVNFQPTRAGNWPPLWPSPEMFPFSFDRLIPPSLSLSLSPSHLLIGTHTSLRQPHLGIDIIPPSLRGPHHLLELCFIALYVLIVF